MAGENIQRVELDLPMEPHAEGTFWFATCPLHGHVFALSAAAAAGQGIPTHYRHICYRAMEA